MKFIKAGRSETQGAFMAPMMDVVFLLLCFFMTSQLFAQWETEIDVQLPTAETGQLPQRAPGEIIINLRADGTPVVHAQVLDEAALSGLLHRVSDLWPGQPVLIRADRATAYEHVIRVLDACRRADIWNISFATAMPDAP